MNELKCGWWEITPESLMRMRGEHMPDTLLQAVEPILTTRFENEELFESAIESILHADAIVEHGATIKRCARQDPFEPEPDCMLLDVMMPVESHYSLRETEDGKRTGLRALDDEDLRDKMRTLPVVVVTIDCSIILSDSFRQAFPQVRWVLHKPVLATDILPILKVIKKLG
ncbi:MAG TPA: hypothetical protein PKN00_22140 [Sedimentisphaerales bacterium]|nr:hypothetical protein [Sedimentisphaerales bacterium]